MSVPRQVLRVNACTSKSNCFQWSSIIFCIFSKQWPRWWVNKQNSEFPCPHVYMIWKPTLFFRDESLPICHGIWGIFCFTCVYALKDIKSIFVLCLNSDTCYSQKPLIVTMSTSSSWWHQRLSSWQPPVPPVTTNLAWLGFPNDDLRWQHVTTSLGFKLKYICRLLNNSVEYKIVSMTSSTCFCFLDLHISHFTWNKTKWFHIFHCWNDTFPNNFFHLGQIVKTGNKITVTGQVYLSSFLVYHVWYAVDLLPIIVKFMWLCKRFTNKI